MSAGHTKGPWFVAKDDPECVVFNEGDKIADLEDGVTSMLDMSKFIDANTIANARLIAAAPDLLAFVQRYLEVWNAGTGTTYLIDDARATIAKATGGAA